MTHLLGFCDVVRVVVAEGIHTVAVGEGFVPMLEGTAVGIQHLKQAVVAQQHHVAYLVALGERGMGGHDEAATFTQLVDHVLLHVEVLHEGKVRAIHRLCPNANLMRLVNEAITVFIGRNISLSISPMRVDAHIVRDAVVVIA